MEPSEFATVSQRRERRCEWMPVDWGECLGSRAGSGVQHCNLSGKKRGVLPYLSGATASGAATTSSFAFPFRQAVSSASTRGIASSLARPYADGERDGRVLPQKPNKSREVGI